MSSHKSRPRRSTPRPSPAGSLSDRDGASFGGDSSRGYESNVSHDNSGFCFSDRKHGGDTLEPPLRDKIFIKQTYYDVDIPARIAEDPKDSLTEFASQVPGTTLSFKYQVGTLNGQKLWRLVYFVFRVLSDVMILVANSFDNRSTITLETYLLIVGEGDSPTKEDSEKLAVLSVIYQLAKRGLVGTLITRS